MSDDPIHNHPDMAWDMAWQTSSDWKVVKKLLERLERFTDGFEKGEEGHKLNRQIQAVLSGLPPPPNSKE